MDFLTSENCSIYSLYTSCIIHLIKEITDLSLYHRTVKSISKGEAQTTLQIPEKLFEWPPMGVPQGTLIAEGLALINSVIEKKEPDIQAGT